MKHEKQQYLPKILLLLIKGSQKKFYEKQIRGSERCMTVKKFGCKKFEQKFD